jgi:hypothetical protein
VRTLIAEQSEEITGGGAALRVEGILEPRSGASGSARPATSDADEFVEVVRTNANRVQDTHVRERPAGAELVDGGAAHVESLGDLVDGEETIAPGSKSA